MRRLFVSLLLAACAVVLGAAQSQPAGEQGASNQLPNAAGVEIKKRYQTTKTLASLQKCLTESLTERGDVTAVPIGNMVTLMYREGKDPPMMIDIEPPVVTVTTKFALGTERLVEICL